MKKEIKIPDIAENVEKGTIAAILVSKGDKVTVDQPLVEIETEKASTDIPSLYDGVVDEIKVKEGDEVKVNQVIMIIETDDGGEEEAETKNEEESSDKNAGKKSAGEKDDENRKHESGEDRISDKSSEGAQQASSEPERKKSLSEVPAAPSVRRIAREMEVELTKVKGSGPSGRITADDVKQHGKQEDAVAQNKPDTKEQLPDFSQWGPVSAEKVNTIRKLTAENVTESWQNIPHVTHFDEADITKLENFRKQFQEKVEKDEVKITVTALLLKITGYALQKFPKFNASLRNGEILYKHYFNIGVAVDTPRGLLVPVIREVNSKSLVQLSVELDDLAQKARDKKIAPEEMQGGNFTISNLGGIGGTGFTPIILPPQVAILGVSRAAWKAVYIGDELQKRMILPLSVSYDHRIIDGADGARFLRWICNVIEDPFAILL